MNATVTVPQINVNDHLNQNWTATETENVKVVVDFFSI